VPQHTAHRVSWRTGPSFIVAARRDVQWPMRSGRREDARAGATTETCFFRVEEAVCVAIDWKFQRRRRSVGTDDSLSNVWSLTSTIVVCQSSMFASRRTQTHATTTCNVLIVTRVSSSARAARASRPPSG
jgi:hypothetical protein